MKPVSKFTASPTFWGKRSRYLTTTLHAAIGRLVEGAARPTASNGELNIVTFGDGSRYLLMSDGSIRANGNRRPAGLSGRQRRIARKLNNRTALHLAQRLQPTQSTVNNQSGVE